MILRKNSLVALFSGFLLLAPQQGAADFDQRVQQYLQQPHTHKAIATSPAGNSGYGIGNSAESAEAAAVRSCPNCTDVVTTTAAKYLVPVYCRGMRNGRRFTAAIIGEGTTFDNALRGARSIALVRYPGINLDCQRWGGF